MSDNRAEVRREVIAELVELAKRHRAGHYDIYQQATEAGKDDLATRAGYGMSAWQEVELVLRADPAHRATPGRNGGKPTGGRRSDTAIGG